MRPFIQPIWVGKEQPRLRASRYAAAGLVSLASLSWLLSALPATGAMVLAEVVVLVAGLGCVVKFARYVEDCGSVTSRGKR